MAVVCFLTVTSSYECFEYEGSDHYENESPSYESLAALYVYVNGLAHYSYNIHLPNYARVYGKSWPRKYEYYSTYGAQFRYLLEQ